MEMSGGPYAAATTKSDKPILELVNVTKTYGSREVVRGLSLDVYPGEVFGFLGPNGAGKTTTIRMLVGLIALSAGEIKINGFSIRNQKKQALKFVGSIVENPEMYKYMSGYKNLLHFARMIPGITKHRIQEMVELVGLEDRIHDKVKTYSLGMRQRLGVAQALLHKPSLLVLDEPTNGLDPAGIRELRDYLKVLAHVEGTAIIVSSHLLSEMELMCDRAAIIQNGALVEIQSLAEVKEADEVLDVFFEVDKPKYGAEQVMGMSSEFVREVHPNGFSVKALKESIPLITDRLVGTGVKVYAISKRGKSLEDKFLEITRRGARDASAVARS